MILDTGVGPLRSSTYLPATLPHLFWGRLPCAADSPVLSVDTGTEVTIDTISHEGIMEDQGRDPRAFFERYGDHEVLGDAIDLAASGYERTFGVDGPHVVTGPIEVRGAQVGDLLAITVLETLPRVPYGVISNRHGKGALPLEYPLGGADIFSAFASVRQDPDGAKGVLTLRPGGAKQVAFPLAPFLGVMGVAVPGDQRPHSVPPGIHGGNMDINLLTVGATLYLPVQVEGALAYVGDPHFAQGDGEVSLTAMEASLRVTLALDVIAREDASAMFGDLTGPLAQTCDHLVPTGMDEDLDVAVQNCVRAAISLLQARFDMDPQVAYAYLSAATDFNISQVVDVVKGVHARIRKADFE
jgi:acetamidase/formamidase